MARNIYNWTGGILGVVFMALSLAALLCKDNLPFGWTAPMTGKVLVAAWAILPPAFFWLDWVGFCRNATAPERDAAKHTHDLSRNIWLGLLGVLTFGFKLTP